MFAAKIQQAGFRLVANGEKLIVEPVAGKPLTDGQRLFIRQHKAEILAELKAANESAPIAQRLESMAQAFQHPLRDLLDWFADDLGTLGAMDEDGLRWVVTDYIFHINLYRGPGYRPELAGTTPSATTHRCADCQHFQRIDHPHLGHCAKGQHEAIAGLWDTTPRSCTAWEPIP